MHVAGWGGAQQTIHQAQPEGVAMLRLQEHGNIPVPFLPGNRRQPCLFSPMAFPLHPKTLYGAARFAFGEI
jgi:hypothetical protein